jgi:hypothetical protein
MRIPASTLLLTATILLHGVDAWQDTFPFRIAAAPPRPPWATSTIVISLQFEGGMPSDLQIVRLARRDADRAWHLAETVRTTTSGGRATVEGPIGVETLLLISAAGQPGYILDGPFRWPSRASTYVVRSNWRKTVRGSFAGVRGLLEWVSADENSLPAATCEWTDGPNWECVGIPLNAAGVVVMATMGEVKCGIPSGTLSPSGVDIASTRTAPWGRLVIAQTGLSPPAGAVHMSVRRSAAPPSRPLSTRLDVRTDIRVQVDTIADGIAWISGLVEVQEDDGWVEIEARGRGRERVGMRELTGAPADVPLRVQLQPPASLSGFVKSASGAAASGTVLTLYRFAAADRDDRKLQELRLAVAETMADASGSFHFDDLSVEPYEVVALHPVFGRGVRRVTPDGREIEIALQSSARPVGRVVRGGVPAEGVSVVVVPDLVQFASAADVSELRGGEVESDPLRPIHRALAGLGRSLTCGARRDRTSRVAAVDGHSGHPTLTARISPRQPTVLPPERGATGLE